MSAHQPAPGLAHYVNALAQELHETIPLVRALGLQVSIAESNAQACEIAFAAALAPNINDKGCAFGGSLASLMTLACWSVLRVHTWTHGVAADIFVHTSRVIYIAPIWQDFSVHARLDAQALENFNPVLLEKSKAAAVIHAEVRFGDTVAATMEARFVAKRAAG
jgi:thioesterase domain-containing protein